MKKLIALFALAFLTAGVAQAEIQSEQLVTADTGIVLTFALTDDIQGVGPQAVDAATNGSATITFMWLSDTERDDVVRSITHYLRSSYPPRHFTFAGGPDSCYVNVSTATEVVLSW